MLQEPYGFQETPSALILRATLVNLAWPQKLLQQLLPLQQKQQPPQLLAQQPLSARQQQQRNRRTRAPQNAPGLANDLPLDTMSGQILTTMAGAMFCQFLIHFRPKVWFGCPWWLPTLLALLLGLHCRYHRGDKVSSSSAPAGCIIISSQPHLYRCPDGEIFSVNGHKCGKESESHTCEPSEIPPPVNVPVNYQLTWKPIFKHKQCNQCFLTLEHRWTSWTQLLYCEPGVFTLSSDSHGYLHLLTFTISLNHHINLFKNGLRLCKT